MSGNLNNIDYYPNINDQRQTNVDIYSVTMSDVLNKIVIDYLTNKQQIPNEFQAIVRRIVKSNDKEILVADPFHNSTIEKERFKNKGKVLNVAEKIVAYLEVPTIFFGELHNGIDFIEGGNVFTKSYYTLLRTEISDLPEDRQLKGNEVIIIEFANPSSLSLPKFKRFPEKKSIILVDENAQTVRPRRLNDLFTQNPITVPEAI